MDIELTVIESDPRSLEGKKIKYEYFDGTVFIGKILVANRTNFIFEPDGETPRFKGLWGRVVEVIEQ